MVAPHSNAFFASIESQPSISRARMAIAVHKRQRRSTVMLPYYIRGCLEPHCGIRRIWSLLSKCSVIAYLMHRTLPNVQSATQQARTYRYCVLRPPEHVLHWTENALDSLSKSVGLAIAATPAQVIPMTRLSVGTAENQNWDS